MGAISRSARRPSTRWASAGSSEASTAPVALPVVVSHEILTPLNGPRDDRSLSTRTDARACDLRHAVKASGRTLLSLIEDVWLSQVEAQAKLYTPPSISSHGSRDGRIWPAG